MLRPLECISCAAFISREQEANVLYHPIRRLLGVQRPRFRLLLSSLQSVQPVRVDFSFDPFELGCRRLMLNRVKTAL